MGPAISCSLLWNDTKNGRTRDLDRRPSCVSGVVRHLVLGEAEDMWDEVPSALTGSPKCASIHLFFPSFFLHSPIPDGRPPLTESDWLRYLVPLPRQVSIPGSVTCSRKAVRVAAAGPADEVLEEGRGSPCGGGGQPLRGGAAADRHPRQDRRPRGRSGGSSGRRPEPRSGLRDHLPLGGGDRRRRGIERGRPLRRRHPGAAVRRVGRVRLPRGAPRRDRRLAGDTRRRGVWNFPDEHGWVPWMAGLKLNFGKMAGTSLGKVERGRPVCRRRSTPTSWFGRGVGDSPASP